MTLWVKIPSPRPWKKFYSNPLTRFFIPKKPPYSIFPRSGQTCWDPSLRKKLSPWPYVIASWPSPPKVLLGPKNYNWWNKKFWKKSTNVSLYCTFKISVFSINPVLANSHQRAEKNLKQDVDKGPSAALPAAGSPSTYLLVRLSRAFAGALHLGPFSTSFKNIVCQQTAK